ncbi:hypothetical protein D3C71_1392090 [compost metagenome]
MTGHGRVGIEIDHVETDGRANDAIELAAEFQIAAEHAPMQVQVVRWLVHEVDAARAPVRAEQGRAQTERHADGQFRGLATGHRRFGDHLFTNDHHLAALFNEDGQRVVHQMTVAHHHLQCFAQGALMTEQQADHAEVRKLARLGHAQAEGLATAGGGRIFQQTHGGIDGDAGFGVLQLSLVQACDCQDVVRVESHVLGNFQVFGQNGGANKRRHA